MRERLQKKYALTDEGVNDLFKGIISSVLLNLSIMLTMGVSLIFLKQYVDEFLGHVSPLHLSLIHFVGIILAIFILMYFASRNDLKKCSMKVYEESARSRISLAEKLKMLPLSYFSKKDLADLSASMLSDVWIREMLFANTVPKSYGGLISISLMFLLMLYFDYRLTLSLFWALPVAFLIFFISKKRIAKLNREVFDMSRRIIDDLQEALSLVQEIKAYNREKHFIDKLHQKYDRDMKIKKRGELIPGAILNISFSILRLGMLTMTVYGAYLIIEGKVDLFTYLAFMIVSSVVFNPIIKAFYDMTVIMFLERTVERMQEINEMPSQGGCTVFQPENYDIVFDNVNFSYEEGINVLKNVSFTAKQGEITALVGPSGGGKTTAAGLAARFWDIQGGKITIGGVDISTIDPEILLEKFSIVFQEVMLFNASVMENIRLGREGASDEEVRRAAALANCDEFVEKLAEGYDTLIGENGANLSGGERQRISIARALLKDAPVILLDESTASLDAENESKIQAGISELIKDKTVLVIAHRMRTVIGADHIVVIKDGEVMESGDAAALIESDGIFANMYHMQMGNGI
ncbi:MAG: ABC transporter ATP-binding protein [Eubacteriales bacterium]|nr:ABC transporter ATP-binding protein [Eubacteriales bacterium]